MTRTKEASPGAEWTQRDVGGGLPAHCAQVLAALCCLGSNGRLFTGHHTQCQLLGTGSDVNTDTTSYYTDFPHAFYSFILHSHSIVKTNNMENKFRGPVSIIILSNFFIVYDKECI